MKKTGFKKIIFFIFALQLLAFTNISQASTLNLIFFYPGGQGSQQEAQPILDQFATGLKKASDGKITASITYLSDTQKGLDFIAQQKPHGGIISYDVFLAHQKDWKLKSIAQTLQLPSADGNNQYFLIKNKAQNIDASKPLNIYSSQKLAKDFVKSKLFPQLTQAINLQHTQNIMGKLRKLGMGETTDEIILLDQFEYHNVSRLRIAWVANIDIMQKSELIPTAPFVIFENKLNAETSEILKQALLKLSKDSEMKETLQLLRLKGFK